MHASICMYITNCTHMNRMLQYPQNITPTLLASGVQTIFEPISPATQLDQLWDHTADTAWFSHTVGMKLSNTLW